MNEEILLKDNFTFKIVNSETFLSLIIDDNIFNYDRILCVLNKELYVKILFASLNVTYEVKFIFENKELKKFFFSKFNVLSK